MPAPIHELAVKLLGLDGATDLANAAVRSTLEMGGHSFKMWTRKADDTFTAAVGREFGGHHCTGSCIGYKYPELASKAGLAVDVGGNIGDTSMLALAFNPRLQLMTFEASPPTYVLLKWNLLENNIPEITESDITS